MDVGASGGMSSLSWAVFTSIGGKLEPSILRGRYSWRRDVGASSGEMVEPFWG